jgi:hypothetical protein
MRRAVSILATAVLLQLVLVTVAGAQTKISGTIQCGKPDPQQSIDVGDRPNHSLGISKSTCTWTKPMEIGGGQTKEGFSVASTDVSVGKAQSSGYHVTTMAGGDKFNVRYHGTDTMKEGTPPSSEGTWSFTSGTGKLKGIKGKGTYKGTGAADGTMTFEVEGEYELPK